MKNAVHGSDNETDANKERDIFKFLIPQKVPEFKFEKFKITLDMLLKFIYPPNLEHSNVMMQTFSLLNFAGKLQTRHFRTLWSCCESSFCGYMFL